MAAASCAANRMSFANRGVAVGKRAPEERSREMDASLQRSKGDLDPSITIEHIDVKSHSGNKGRRRRGAIVASR